MGYRRPSLPRKLQCRPESGLILSFLATGKAEESHPSYELIGLVAQSLLAPSDSGRSEVPFISTLLKPCLKAFILIFNDKPISFQAKEISEVALFRQPSPSLSKSMLV